MNYDEQLKQIEIEKAKAIQTNNSSLDNLINENSNIYQQQNEQLNTWKTQQDKLINDSVNFTQEGYVKQQNEAEQDYQKEAKASNIDYQKFINDYGVNAEQQARSGLKNAGYSETTKLGAFNTTQNRTALARATFQKIKSDFDMKIKEAKLTGDTQLAEIAFKQMQMQKENALNEFNFKSGIEQNRLSMNTATDNTYYGRIQDAMTRKEQEIARQEAIRQYNEQMAYKKEQDLKAQQQWERELAYKQKQDAIQNAQTWARINADKKSNEVKITDTSGSGTTPSNTTNDGYTTNYGDLGFGPINQTTLKNLIGQGKVLAKNVNGTIVYKKA